jgi:hypothetical protein
VSQPARTVVRRLDDDRAEVDITGAPPSVALAAHACPRAARSLADCDDLDVDGSTTTAADGSATFVATRAAGDRRLVLSSGSVVVAEPVLLAARRGGTLVHDGRGIAAGFAIAGIFLALAVWLVRTTDWRVPAEAATPFLDAASLGPDR